MMMTILNVIGFLTEISKLLNFFIIKTKYLNTYRLDLLLLTKTMTKHLYEISIGIKKIQNLYIVLTHLKLKSVR